MLSKFIPQSQFNVLYKSWVTCTKIHSSFLVIRDHPSYGKLISLGKGILPYIARELFIQGDDPDTIRLVTLAQEITKVHIHIPKEDQGKTKVIANLWLKWWEEHKDEY